MCRINDPNGVATKEEVTVAELNRVIQEFVPELDGGDLAHAEVGHARQGIVQQVLLVIGA